jgi:hypothetical protein
VAEPLASYPLAGAVAVTLSRAGRATSGAGWLAWMLACSSWRKLGLVSPVGMVSPWPAATRSRLTGILDRPSEDIDLFTAWERRDEFE